ncbi:M24 family metallopeptidase [Sphingomonas sp. BIUV-7]|uniref:M24 family metallopeptidase n=1 Tax=Sphingomonas natans TaxID=3063330 RepID=A0ABT8YEK1_9SPHN|nr:M24 family metallopeptidase [Sphingomonas sp. BIUV-7]MDO6416806.1 M24 family metallopeptidase [Sphingomonas sp. BIUV-7]
MGIRRGRGPIAGVAAALIAWAGAAQAPTTAQMGQRMAKAPVTAPILPMSDVEQASPAPPFILGIRDRAALENAILAERLDTVVPAIMRAQKIDMWVLVAREYFEDPVVATMLNAESLHARRRTILIFFDPGAGKPIERLTVSRYGLGGLFQPAWDPDKQPDQWKAVAEIVAARNPKAIAINTSSLSAFADGMTLSQYKDLTAALPQAARDRIVSGEKLAIGWLQTRSPMEMQAYPGILRLAHSIIADAFSRKVITPGRTTADDVVWWYRQRLSDLGLVPWFHPSIGVIRKGSAAMLEGDTIIQPGDLLWTDFGITYLRLNTDTQHLAYVLKQGETEAPAGLRAGLRAANGVQDALLSSFRVGATGNEVLAAARAKAIAAGLKPSIYSHPLGYHGHAAGPAIGFWDDQRGDERGSTPIAPNTTWSIELAAYLAVPEWGGQEVQFRAEENAYFDGTRVRFLDGRQTAIRLIPNK